MPHVDGFSGDEWDDKDEAEKPHADHSSCECDECLRVRSGLEPSGLPGEK